MKVKVFPYRERIGMGNMMWSGPRFEMRGGKFPKEHPVGGGSWDAPDGQGGSGENIKAFRARGYWASCFPEGDGITWKPLNGQSDTQCMSDIRDCFVEWDVHWAVGSNVEGNRPPREAGEKT